MGLGSRIRDPGSGKNLFRIPDPGVKKAPDPDPQHWMQGNTRPGSKFTEQNKEEKIKFFSYE